MFDVLFEILGVEAMTLRRAALLEIIIWAVMLVAVMIDMRAGIRKAKAAFRYVASFANYVANQVVLNRNGYGL